MSSTNLSNSLLAIISTATEVRNIRTPLTLCTGTQVTYRVPREIYRSNDYNHALTPQLSVQSSVLKVTEDQRKCFSRALKSTCVCVCVCVCVWVRACVCVCVCVW